MAGIRDSQLVQSELGVILNAPAVKFGDAEAFDSFFPIYPNSSRDAQNFGRPKWIRAALWLLS